MVRTKADRVPSKAVGEKSTAKKNTVKVNTLQTTNNKRGKKYSGGNPYYPRETPKWQKSITCFLNMSETTSVSTEDQDLDVKERKDDSDKTD